MPAQAGISILIETGSPGIPSAGSAQTIAAGGAADTCTSLSIEKAVAKEGFTM